MGSAHLRKKAKNHETNLKDFDRKDKRTAHLRKKAKIHKMNLKIQNLKDFEEKEVERNTHLRNNVKEF